MDKLISWLKENWQATVALAALTLTVIEIYFSRRHNKLSVIPHLDLHQDTAKDTNTITSHIENNGIGPAKITSYEVRFDGQLQKNNINYDMAEELLKYFGTKTLAHIQRAYIGVGTYVPVAKRIKILTVQVQDDSYSVKDFDNLQKWLNRFDVTIYYQSIYGVGWHEPPYCMDTRDKQGTEAKEIF